jgi:hypothetical protein
MLQEDGGRERVHIALAATCGTAQVTDGTECHGGRIPLVHETHREAGPFLQLGGYAAYFDGPRCVVAVRVERQPNDVAYDFERLTTPDHLGNGRTFAAPTLDVAGWGCNGAGWIAHSETYTTVSEVNREKTRGVLGNRESGIESRWQMADG